MERGPLCCGAINRYPIDRLSDQTAAPQIAPHIRPRSAGLGGGEDAPKDPKSKGVPHFQAMQSGEWQRVGRSLKDGLGARAIGIVDLIRDQKTGVRVEDHAGLVALLVPCQQN